MASEYSQGLKYNYTFCEELQIYINYRNIFTNHSAKEQKNHKWVIAIDFTVKELQVIKEMDHFSTCCIASHEIALLIVVQLMQKGTAFLQWNKRYVRPTKSIHRYWITIKNEM